MSKAIGWVCVAMVVLAGACATRLEDPNFTQQDPQSSTDAGPETGRSGAGGVGGSHSVPEGNGGEPDAGAEPSPPDPNLSTVATTALGPAGGRLDVSGASIVIPPGALADGTTFSVSQTAFVPEDPLLASPVYQLEPHGVVFDKPIEVSLEVPPGMEDPVLYRIQEEGGEPEYLEFVREGSRLTASVDHFCWFGSHSSYYSYYYYPSCASGLTGSYYSGCYDINECASNNGGCDLLTTCTNTYGSYQCGTCPRGTVNTGSARAPKCTACTAGSYCAGQGAARQLCEGTTWDHDADASTPCVQKTTCAAGTFLQNAQSGTEDRICAPCSEGTFSTMENAAACTAKTVCQPGQYVLDEGSTTQDRQCAACPAGELSTEGNAAECTSWSTCSAGTFVVAAPSSTLDRMCQACAEDTFSLGENEASCQPQDACAAGTEVLFAGSASQATTCAPCPMGTFCSGGMASAVACAPGTWDHDADPATACAAWTECTAGQYVQADGSATSDRTCAACQPGTFTTSRNASQCGEWSSCAAGQYVQAEGSVTADRSCSPCPSGAFSVEANTEACMEWVDCAPGTYVDNVPSAQSDRSCQSCEPDTYSALPNQSSCQTQEECPAGTEQTEPGTIMAPPTCSPCPVGTHCPGASLPRVDCAEGYWDADADPATACVPRSECGSGSYVLDAGSSSTDRQCLPCPEGTFNTQLNASNCEEWLVCTPGQYVSMQGSATTNRLCGECESGTFSDVDNAVSCSAWEDCEPGSYVLVAPSTEQGRTCAACPSDTYSDQPNQASCTPFGSCPAGTEQLAAGSATTPRTCGDCEAGNYCAGGAMPRQACGDSSWDHDSNPATPCVDKSSCAAGEYVVLDGGGTADRICAGCTVGSFSTAVNSQACTPWRTCTAGMSVSSPGSTTTDRQCVGCSSGSFSTADNAATCTSWSDCVAGTYVAAAGDATTDRTCAECAPETYTTLPNQSLCTGWEDCAAGTEMTAPGSASMPPTCAACPAGSYCPGGELAKETCASGSWDHDASAATACVVMTSCVAGQYVTHAGTATSDRACAACSAQSFSTVANAAQCAAWTTCEAGSFVTAEGTASSDRTCDSCWEGSFALEENATTCSSWASCDPGFYAALAGTPSSDRVCEACPEGYFSSDYNESACSPWSVCGSGETELTEPTATSDRVCGPMGWVQQWASSNNQLDEAFDVTRDDAGDVYVVGYTQGSLHGVNPSQNNYGYDAWISKLDPDGAVLWSQQFGTSDFEQAMAVTTDAAGDVYVVGKVNGSFAAPTAGQQDAFVRKLSPSGSVLWTRQWGSSGADLAEDIVVDASGTVYVVGTTTAVMGDASAGSYDVFISRLDEEGGDLGTWQWGTATLDEGKLIELDADGNLLVAGYTSGAFPGYTAAGRKDVFVRKLSSAGSTLWTQQWGTDQHDYVAGMALDALGNVYVVGSTDGSLEGTSAGNTDAFITKLGTDGTRLWTRQWGTVSADYANRVAIGANGTVYVVGMAGGDLAAPSLGGWDTYVRRLSSDGSVLSTDQFGTAGDERIYGGALDAAGRLYIAGSTTGSMAISNPLGNTDAFLLQMAAD